MRLFNVTRLFNLTRWFTLLSAVFVVAVCLPARASAYSVLTHEAIIDSAWPNELRPLLVARFPNATADQLREAHAYAYGGAIIQDMGYYPFGSKFFSDLVHYARSGDFVIALLKDARESADINDYAFALGALAHYAADNLGHPVAVNRTVPVGLSQAPRQVRSGSHLRGQPRGSSENRIWFRCHRNRARPICFGSLSRLHRISSRQAAS